MISANFFSLVMSMAPLLAEPVSFSTVPVEASVTITLLPLTLYVSPLRALSTVAPPDSEKVTVVVAAAVKLFAMKSLLKSMVRGLEFTYSLLESDVELVAAVVVLLLLPVLFVGLFNVSSRRSLVVQHVNTMRTAANADNICILFILNS